MSDPQGPKATEIECKDDSATSSQTPTNDQGSDNQEAPVEKLPIRIEQPNDAYLVNMPSEVILSITDHMDRQSLKSLALTSARLYHTVSNAFYRSFNYETYRLALERGDFAQIKRCIEHNAAPSNVIWTKENAKPQFPFFRARRDLLPYLDHKPINYLVFAFEDGKMTADQCLFVLRRLVKNGGDIATTWTDFDDHLKPEQVGVRAEFARKLRHIPHYFLLALLKETDRAKLKGVASIINYLSTQGFNFPQEIDTWKYNKPLFSSWWRNRYFEFHPLPELHSDSPVGWMMHSACPPSVLEAFLEHLLLQDATLTSPLEKCPWSFRWTQDYKTPGGRNNWNENTLRTQLWELTPRLCNELLDPLGWRPIYDGEVSDIWEAKLNLLDRYQGIDSFERRHLVSILTSLRKIEDKIREQGVSVLRRNAKACLVELTAMLPSYPEESDIPTDNLSNFAATRIHSFSLRARFDVDSWWHRHMPRQPYW